MLYHQQPVLFQFFVVECPDQILRVLSNLQHFQIRHVINIVEMYIYCHPNVYTLK